jgi:thymidylate synthase
MEHEEYQYINLVKQIQENGFIEQGRNGATKSIFGNMMKFSLRNNKIPIFTSKKTAWKTCLKELLWFIRGDTDNKLLEAENVHIWDGNASKEFMASRNLSHYPDGMLGPIYGYQWRYFDAPYDSSTGKPEINAKQLPYMDQLQNIINALKDPQQRTSRRLIMTAWNPNQLDEMALPPCHVMCQFNVHDGNKLSCALYQRSCDVALGVSFNVASYSILTHLLAKHCNLEAYEFVYFMGNCHLYEDHIEPMNEILTRSPYEFPTLTIKTQRDNISNYEVSDFIVNDYKSHDVIKMKMIA